MGTQARRRAAVGGVLAGRVRRPRRVAADWLIFEEEYYAAGAPGRVEPERPLPARPHAFRAWHRRAARPDPAAAWPAPTTSGRRPGPSPRRAATWPRSAPPPPAVDGGWLLNGQKTWSSRAAFADRGFGLFRTEPGRAAAPRPHLLHVRPARRRASPCGRSPSSTASRDSPRSSSRTVFVPDRGRRSASRAEGWRVAMSTASHERGLSLRSPGRFLATADRLLRAVARGRRPGRHRAARPGRRRVDRRAGLPAGTPTPPSTGSRLAESWARNPVPAKCSGPNSILACTRPRWTCSAPTHDERWTDGYLFSLAGPIYAGTNEIQRNVIAERLLGLPR